MHLTRWLDFDFSHTHSLHLLCTRLTSNHTSTSIQTNIKGFSVKTLHAHISLFEDLASVCIL